MALLDVAPLPIDSMIPGFQDSMIPRFHGFMRLIPALVRPVAQRATDYVG